MISLSLLILFIAFYVFYNTSEKAIKHKTFGFETWLNKQQKKGKILAVALLVIAMLLSCNTFGLGAGTMLFFICLMTVGSLIVILNPLKLLTPKSITILFILSLLIEFSII